MRALPIVLAAAAVFAVVRLRLRRAGHRPASPLGTLRTPLGGRAVLGETGLVAAREIRERVRGRVFRVVTLVLFGVVAAAVVIPTIDSGSAAPHRVGVVDGSPGLNSSLAAIARSAHLEVRLVPEATLPAARASLDARRLDMVVDGTQRILVRDPVSSTDTSTGTRYVRAVAAALGAQHAFAEAGLTPAQATVVTRAAPLPVDSIHPARTARTAAEATALLGVILVFLVLTQYLTWTLMGVMEEKASRVAEVLLATVRPIQLLAGKVIGIGTVAMAQAVALVAFALVLAEAVGSSLTHGAAPLVVAAALVWLVLGYAFYSWMYAAAGSLAERQDQVQSLALPLSAPLVFGYITALTGISAGSPSTLVKVLAYVPPTAPFAMPTLVGFGAAAWWEFLLSAALTLLCTSGVAVLAARVYRTALLQTGRRVRLRDLAARRAS